MVILILPNVIKIRLIVIVLQNEESSMETSTRSDNKSEADPVMDLFPDEDNEERGKKNSPRVLGCSNLVVLSWLNNTQQNMRLYACRSANPVTFDKKIHVSL